MYAVLVLLAIGLTAVKAGPIEQTQRIVGGVETTIARHPHLVSLLVSADLESYHHGCGGTILNEKNVLTATHCFATGMNPVRYRIRTGSTSIAMGGTVYAVQTLIPHPQYQVTPYLDHDIAIARIALTFILADWANVNVAPIAGPNYVVPDGGVVWVSGWGAQTYQGPISENLREVQIWTVNHELCRARYSELENAVVTDNMICAGDLDVGGRDTCQGDSGGPLTHNGVLVGVISWGAGCALPRYPGVSMKVSSYTTWIQANT